MAHKFIRQDWFRFSKFGKKRNKLLKWRRPKGTHSKVRIRKKGNPTIPIVGRKTPSMQSGKIGGFNPILVHNLKELESLNKKTDVVILAKIGAKKKLEVIKKAETIGLRIINLGKGGKK